MLSSSSLFFVVTGIQFWISDYMRIILKQDQQTVFLCYSITSLTAPVLGVLLGGHILDRYGGYSGPYALNICLVFGTLASISGIPIPFFSNFSIVVVFLWLLLLFGGALMPAVTGIMISSIPKYLRSFGNSNAQLIQNLLGYFPSPFIYGLVCNVTGGEESRAGMILLMCWSAWGVLGLSIAKSFFAQHLKKNAADNRIFEETSEKKHAILRPSFVKFRDKNTAVIFNKLLNRPEEYSVEVREIEKPHENIEMKPLEQGISLRVYESLYGDQAKGPFFDNDNFLSPLNQKNVMKTNSMNPEVFSSTENLDISKPFLKGKERTSRISHKRNTSLFGGLSNMFGKANLYIGDESEEEEEEEENDLVNFK